MKDNAQCKFCGSADRERQGDFWKCIGCGGLSNEFGGFHITARRAEGEKCSRCWNTSKDVGEHLYWPTWKLCPRCVGVLLETRQPPFFIDENGRATPYKDEADFWKHVRLDPETQRVTRKDD